MASTAASDTITETELNEILEFLNMQINEIKCIEKELEENISRRRDMKALTIEQLSDKEVEVINEEKARLLSTLTIVTTYVNGLIEKFKLLPVNILNALKLFYDKVLGIINKFINLFQIEQITLTISVQPSLQIVFKPKQP
ncbi:MAG: hypothetical protein QXU29_07755 [Candidatus Nitrosocaldus sp.]